MTDPHPVRSMRDGEMLRWTTSSGKSLRLGGGREADRGAWGFADFGGLDVRMGDEGEGRGSHGLGTRLSKMWGKLQKYAHRFEVVLSVQGYHEHFACRDFTGGGSFRARCNFGIARRGLRWRELSEHNETKIYLKYFGLTRRGLKFPDKPNVYCTKSMRPTNVIQNFEFMLCSIKNISLRVCMQPTTQMNVLVHSKHIYYRFNMN